MQHVPFWKVIIGAVIFFLSFVNIGGGGAVFVYSYSCLPYFPSLFFLATFDISNYSLCYFLVWLFLSSASYICRVGSQYMYFYPPCCFGACVCVYVRVCPWLLLVGVAISIMFLLLFGEAVLIAMCSRWRLLVVTDREAGRAVDRSSSGYRSAPLP